MRWLGVSRNTFYRLVEGGELPSVRIRGCIRVSTEDLLAFIQNNRVGPMN
ncbi:MAG: helix-turn-helix domain-containing protein [Proteobacteria bacterium]|nr:helix-turn-helix domain-containing protein [Pseudomonadota bacterium]MCP4920283.1 helix-turn-helix domain-containing protein [Pseudomonadota bacterium]